jgi:serine phosphatase RsbU (regulator of sigma subunit)
MVTPMSYRLSRVEGGRRSSWELPEGESTIGRAGDAAVSLPDRLVSHLHAVVRVRGDRLEIEDLRSRNGTWVNGQRIDGPRTLEEGDRIEVGHCVLEVVAAGSVTPFALEAGHATAELPWSDIASLTSVDGEGATALFKLFLGMSEFLARDQDEPDLYDGCLRAVEQLVPFEFASLLLLDAAGAPVERAQCWRGKTGEGSLRLSRTMVDRVIHERTSLIIPDTRSLTTGDIPQSVRLQRIRSVLVVPLFDNTEVIGALYIDSRDLPIAYGETHLRRLATLGNVLAVKITNSRLRREQRARAEEMRTAAEIQRYMLRERPPCPPGYELCVRLEACEEVAGDLYDVQQLANGRYIVLLGDVVGKGLGAALLGANILSAIRVLAPLVDQPLWLVEHLHQQLCESTSGQCFATLFLGVLDLQRHRLTFVNAGQCEPIVLAADGGLVRLPSTGPPLGLRLQLGYEEESVDLAPGAVFAAWSDGIPEAHRAAPDARLFDDEVPVEQFILERRDQPLDRISRCLFERVDDFLRGAQVPDDRTLLLLRRLPFDARGTATT